MRGVSVGHGLADTPRPESNTSNPRACCNLYAGCYNVYGHHGFLVLCFLSRSTGRCAVLFLSQCREMRCFVFLAVSGDALFCFPRSVGRCAGADRCLHSPGRCRAWAFVAQKEAEAKGRRGEARVSRRLGA
eukprot:1033905-Rhodomonas_salina.3